MDETGQRKDVGKSRIPRAPLRIHARQAEDHDSQGNRTAENGSRIEAFLSQGKIDCRSACFVVERCSPGPHGRKPSTRVARPGQARCNAGGSFRGHIQVLE